MQPGPDAQDFEKIHSGAAGEGRGGETIHLNLISARGSAMDDDPR
jgi:hypothetical protein